MRGVAISILAMLLAAAPAGATTNSRRVFISAPRASGGEPEHRKDIGEYSTLALKGALEKDLPCFTVNSHDSVLEWLEAARQSQLAGYYGHQFGVDPQMDNVIRQIQSTYGKKLDGFKNDTDLMSAIPTMLDARYLVFVTIRILGDDRVDLQFKAMNVRQAKTLAHASDVVPLGAEVIHACDRLATELTKELAYEEPCPYAGEATVKVHSVRNADGKRNQETESIVFCNGGQHVRRVNHTEKGQSDQLWKLQRKTDGGRWWAFGNLELSSVDEWHDAEEDGCYPCSSGRQGGRIWQSDRQMESKVQGLSTDSRVSGDSNDDARVHIRFERDGTYFVRLEAASNRGTYTLTESETAQGTCDPVNRHPPPARGELDVPLLESVGPFPGSPLDKHLKGSVRKTAIDESINEVKETEVVFEFHRK